LAVADQKRREFEQKVAAARAHRMPVLGAGSATPPIAVTSEVIDEIRTQQRFNVLKPWLDAYLLAEQSPEHAEELARMVSEREEGASETKELLTSPGMRSPSGGPDSPLQIAERLIARLNLDAPAGGQERSLVAVAVRQGRLAGERDVDRVLAGELPAATTTRPKPRASGSGPGFTLRDAVDRYLTDRSVRPKTAADVRTTLNLFEQTVGNKRLADLSRADFANFIEELAQKQVGGRSRDSISRMISPSTVQKRLRFLHTVIGHAIQKDLHAGGNPASGFNISAWVKAQDRSLMPEKRPFGVAELNLVFQHPWFTGCESAQRCHHPGSHRLPGVHYWAPIVALFSGCRAAELGGLKLSEVQLDGQFPHLHIRDNEYRPTKEGYARLVPVLDALLKIGFEEYVARVRATGADRLFPDWLPPQQSGGFNKDDARWSNAGPIRAFNRTVIEASLGGGMTPGARRDVTFHGFRGAFKSMLGLTRHGVAPNVINEVVGHAKSGMDKHYIKTVPLEETYPSVKGCNYPGLVIPPAPL
jgi:integrase